jgi:ferritin-like metal-binding protein YciE
MSELGTTNPSNRYNSSAAEGTGENERHSLQTYTSDLLALEEHIGKPLDGQLASDATAEYAQAFAVIQTIKSQNATHAQQLRATLERLGGHPAGPLKTAWASLLGEAAAAIGGARSTKVTKWLRDDYTALNLAAMSYTLLHATAVGLGDPATAQLAKQGLADYSRSVMKINQVIPEVVLNELRKDGEQVRTGAADLIREQTNDIWKDQSTVVHG